MLPPGIDLLVAAAVPDAPPLPAAAHRAALQRSRAFVRRALSAAPVHVRLGIFLLSLPLLAWLLAARLGEGWFASWTPQASLRLFAAPGGPCEGVVRVYRSLSAFAFFDDPAVGRLLDDGSGGA